MDRELSSLWYKSSFHWDIWLSFSFIYFKTFPDSFRPQYNINFVKLVPFFIEWNELVAQWYLHFKFDHTVHVYLYCCRLEALWLYYFSDSQFFSVQGFFRFLTFWNQLSCTFFSIKFFNNNLNLTYKTLFLNTCGWKINLSSYKKEKKERKGSDISGCNWHRDKRQALLSFGKAFHVFGFALRGRLHIKVEHNLQNFNNNPTYLLHIWIVCIKKCRITNCHFTHEKKINKYLLTIGVPQHKK